VDTKNTNDHLKKISLTHIATIMVMVSIPIMLNTLGTINTLDTAQRFSNDASLSV
jgi:hypothetical protein